MPFGLADAPATFQHLIKRVLNGFKWDMCLVYLEDVNVFSTTLNDHLQHLTQVFSQICSAGLKLKHSMCHLLQKCMQHLSHNVSEASTSTQPRSRLLTTGPNPITQETLGPLGTLWLKQVIHSQLCNPHQTPCQADREESCFQLDRGRGMIFQYPQRKADDIPYPAIP